MGPTEFRLALIAAILILGLMRIRELSRWFLEGVDEFRDRFGGGPRPPGASSAR